MKPSHRNPLLRNFVIAATSIISFASLATAGTLYWDGNGTGATGNPPTAGVGGAGTWDTGTTANWWNGTAYQLWNGVDGQDVADFRVAAGTVTVSGTVNVNTMNFSVATNIFNGGTINFGAGGIIDTNAVTGQTINSAVSGPLLMKATGNASTLAGTACYTITGNNTGLTSFELALATANNHIIIDSSGAMGAAASPVKLTTGILNLGNVDGVNRTYNAWTTELAGGTLRGRFSNSILTGPITLTANSGMESRNGANAKLILASTATVNLNANTLKLSAQNSAGSGIELNGNISGTGGILNIAGSSLTNGANGSGIVTLAGTNSYTGGTTVTTSGALLNLRKLSSLPTTGTTAMSTGTTLSLGVATSGDHFSATDLDNLFSGTSAGNLANVTFTGTVHGGIDTTAGDFTYTTAIPSVARNLSKLGANKLTLASAFYTGTTTIYEGTLALSGAGSLGSGALTINGGNLDLAGGSVSIGTLSVAAAAPSGETITAGSLTTSGTTATSYAVSNASGNAVIAASLLANSTAGLTKTGAGNLLLSGANTYTGGTAVSAGNITFLKTASLPTSGIVTVPATSTIGLGVGTSPTFFTGTDVVALLGGTLTQVSNTTAYTVGINTAAGDFDLTDNIGTSTRALSKQGANTLTLSGNNTFDKLITVAEGTLKAGSATAFNNTGSLAVLPGTTFDLNGNAAKFLSVSNSTGTVTTGAAGSGTDLLTISALTAQTGTLFTDGATRKLALLVSAPSGTVDVLGNAANTFSGGLTLGANVRAGAANNSVASGGRFGKGTITIGTAAGTLAQLYFQSNNLTIDNPIVVNTAATVGSRTGAFRVDSTGNILSGQITAALASAVFINGSAASGSVTLTGQITGANGLQANSNSASNPLTLTLNNAGTANDYSGTTSVGANSTLILGAAAQIPNGPTKGNLAVAGTLNLNVFSETINGLTGAGTIDNLTNTASGTANTLTLGDNNATGTSFSGSIKNTTGTLSLTKTGTGIQTLSGPNEYSGATTVGNGTLKLGLASAVATSPTITVDSGAFLDVSTVVWSLGAAQTLKGNGTVTGATTLAGTVAPGASVGTLTMNGNTALTGTYACEVSGASTDLLAVTGDLDLTGGTLAITGTATAGTYVIASYTGTRTGSLGGTLPPGYTVNYDDTNKEVELVVAPAGSAFDTWIDGYPSITGLDKLPAADPDKDGVNNITEFALDGNPASGAATGKVVGKIATVGGNPTLIISLPVRTGATFSGPNEQVSTLIDGVIYKIQGSDELTTWTLVVSEVTGGDKTTIEGTLPAVNTGWTRRTFQSPGAITGDPKEFLRAVIIEAP